MLLNNYYCEDNGSLSKQFHIAIGVHQDSLLRLLLFVEAMEEVRKSHKNGLTMGVSLS